MNVKEICPVGRKIVKEAVLYRGGHESPSNMEGPCEECIMELVSRIEVVCKFEQAKFSDNPLTVCPVIRSFCISLNDNIGHDERQLLKPYAIKLLGTKTTREIEIKRAFICANWACRVLLPQLMFSLGKDEIAANLKKLKPVVDGPTADAAANAADAANAAANAADAAYYDADAAANTAAADAAANANAYYAAYYAAYTAYYAANAAAYAAAAYYVADAANAAAADAAYYAANAAANAAAYYAANAADAKKDIIKSSLRLIDKLIGCK